MMGMVLFLAFRTFHRVGARHRLAFGTVNGPQVGLVRVVHDVFGEGLPIDLHDSAARGSFRHREFGGSGKQTEKYSGSGQERDFHGGSSQRARSSRAFAPRHSQPEKNSGSVRVVAAALYQCM
jgi:hypothetical protein